MMLSLSVLCLASIAGALESVSSIAALNATTHGHVHEIRPLALPCFTSYNGHPVARDAAQCAVIQDNYTSPAFRGARPNGYMNSQDEMCSSNPRDQCLLDESDPTNLALIRNRTCGKGVMPDYYMDVHNARDVIQAFRFTNQTNTPIVVKNTGHDYLGRSSGKGSLALWTRNLKSMQYHPAFVPAGCNISIDNTITTGAGVIFDEVYRFAHRHGKTFIGGYAGSVGVSGGWVQAGGHSVLSPVYGLGVDRVVQYQLVTPDGQLRVANACQNPDLFWALRGGGGGTFGVVLESTHRVEPAMPLTAALIKFPDVGSNLLPFYEIAVNNSVRWAHEGWGGHLSGSSLIYVSPLVSVSQANRSMSQVAAYARAQNGTAVVKQYPSWLEFYDEIVIPNSVGVGKPSFVTSRLIPQSVFKSPAGRQQLMSFVSDVVALGQSPYVPVTPPLLYNSTSPDETSITPAWRGSVWSLGTPTSLAWNSTFAERQNTIRTVNRLTKDLEEATPTSGAYLNEADPFTDNWQEAWWGQKNYGKLLAIKQRYDPDGLLNCWKCVGWKREDAKDSCFAAFEQSTLRQSKGRR